MFNKLRFFLNLFLFSWIHCQSSLPFSNELVLHLKEIINEKIDLKTGEEKKLYGRVICGNDNEYFDRFHINSERRLIFLIGAKDCLSLYERGGKEILVALGYPHEYIESRITKGSYFKLVLYLEKMDQKEATWENVLNLASQAYPEIASDLKKHKRGLELLAFEDFEQVSGFKFKEVAKAGREDERFISYERYLKSNRSLLQTRAFLYFTLRLNELFSGDGYTYDEEGNRRLKEYVALNKNLIVLKDFLLFNIILP